MKCEQAEQYILLEDSRELGALGRYQLDRHVAGCAHCQAFQTDLRTTRSALHAVTAPALSAQTRATILNAAGPDRREVVTLGPSLQPISWWRPALAAAALVALLSVGFHMYAGSGNKAPLVAQASPTAEVTMDDAVDAEIDALQQLLVASLGDSPDVNEGDALLDEDTLARELLALQETVL